MNYIYLIPTYNPNNEFVNIVNNIVRVIPNKIIIINDGSEKIYNKYFELIQKKSGVIVLHHEKNEGKGSALKTGLSYILKNINYVDFIITLDSDGQHLIGDIVNIVNKMKKSPSHLVIGSRKFDEHTPWKSKLGNFLTRILFKMVTKKILWDTQSGLRALPIKIVSKLISLKGRRFEFELQVLFTCVENNIDILEVPIPATYIENNNESNFHPIKDSVKIYQIILLYIFKNFFYKKSKA